ncbi:MAG TPA: hypothetical protein PLP19_22600, partial [bacterium]|nr:hypothetical protein [bacterium]
LVIIYELFGVSTIMGKGYYVRPYSTTGFSKMYYGHRVVPLLNLSGRIEMSYMQPGRLSV